MKKIIAAIVTSLLLIAPAWAGDDTDDAPPADSAIVGNPPAEFAYMVECTASQLTLMHLRLQVAASITALSGTDIPPQLASLVTSYKTLAETDQKQVAVYIDTIKKVIIPEIMRGSTGVKEDDILSKANEMADRGLAQIAVVMSNPHMSFENQAQLQTLLLNQSEKCEALAEKITQRNTL